MRPTHKNRSRSRHRSSSSGSGGSGGSGSGGSGGGNPLSRVYESNGPDVKVRGTAQTVADKYLQLGRDAQSAGDIIMAESCFQFAEHYLRIVSAAQAYNQQSQQQYRRPDDEFDDEELEDGPEAQFTDQRGGQQGSDLEGLGDQPMVEGTNPPQQGQPSQQVQPYRQQRDYRDNRDTGQRDTNQRDTNQRDTGQRDTGQRDNSQRDTNQSQRDSGQRDQNAAPSQNRERFKPRWQDRKPDSQQAQPGEPRQNNQSNNPSNNPSNNQPQNQQPARQEQRSDEQPRVIDAQSAPAPAPAAEADPKWEAPSFLRRPAPVPAIEAEESPAPVIAEMAPAAPAKRKYERKPRKEPVLTAPPVTEPATD